VGGCEGWDCCQGFVAVKNLVRSVAENVEAKAHCQGLEEGWSILNTTS
jgi:hypothetical protein